MKKVILSIIGVVLIIGLFAGAGFAGYRIGYTRGVQASANGDAPLFGRFERFGPQRMSMPNFGRDLDRGFDRGFPRGKFHMMQLMQLMQRGHRFGIFLPLMFLAHLALWVLVIGLIYVLFTRSGLRLSLANQPVQNPPANIEQEVKSQDPNSENE